MKDNDQKMLEEAYDQVEEAKVCTCTYAKDGCDCDECPECRANNNKVEVQEHHDDQMSPEALDMTVGDFLDLLARDYTARELYATIEQYIVDNIESAR